MRKMARYVYIGIAWLTLVSVIVLFFLAGMALFVHNSYWTVHADFGWGSELSIVLLIVTGLVGWIPRWLSAWLVGMSAVHFVQTALPTLKDALPIMAAIHSVSALLLAWVTYMHARRAAQLLLEPRQESERSEPRVQVEPSTQS